MRNDIRSIIPEQEKTLILVNPNGTIQLGIQHHLNDRRTLSCHHCNISLVSSRSAGILVCTNCQTANRVINDSPIGIQLNGELTSCSNCFTTFLKVDRDLCSNCKAVY